MRQKPFERGGGNRHPNQPCDERGIGRIKGRHIGLGFPFLQQPLSLPSPFGRPTDHLDRVVFGGQVGEERAETLGPPIPADHQAQTQGDAIDVPLHHAFHPLAFGECSVDALERLIAQRAQPFPVFTKRLENLRVHPRFGPDEKKAPLVLHATQGVSIDISAIGQ